MVQLGSSQLHFMSSLDDLASPPAAFILKRAEAEMATYY